MRLSMVLRGALALALVACATEVADEAVLEERLPVGDGPGTELTSLEAEDAFVRLANEERVARGLAPLTVYWDLVDDARAWSARMAADGFIHHNPQLGAVTTGWESLGENVGVGGSPEALHAALMASPPHRANLLGDWGYVGVGVVIERGSIWVTQVFMRGPSGLADPPPPADPPPGGITLPSSGAPPCPAGARCDVPALVDPGARFSFYAPLSGSPTVDSLYFGNPGDVALVGDWDCDGVDTPGMYRPTDGYVYLRNQAGSGVADVEFYLGDPSDVPLAGDWNGDGCDTVSVYRRSEGRVYVKNDLGTGVADFAYYFGNPGDEPFAGDFDGDGIDTVGLYRTSTGFVYFRNSHTQGVADVEYYYGDPGDRIAAGDWNGDGVDTLAVYRPSTGRLYVRLTNTQGVADFTLEVGGGFEALGAVRRAP